MANGELGKYEKHCKAPPTGERGETNAKYKYILFLYLPNSKIGKYLFN